MTVDDQLELSEVTSQFEGTVGAFNIPDVSPQTVTFTFSDIFPLISAGTKIVPTTPISEFPQDINYTEFESVKFSSGTMTIAIHNNLAITLGNPVHIDIPGIGRSTFNNPIRPGETDSVIVYLSDKSLSNSISVTVSGNSLGSEGKQVDIDTQSSFEVTVSLNDVKAKEAMANIPNQHFDVSGKIENVNSDTLRVHSADIEQGDIQLTIYNGLDEDLDLDMDISIQNITIAGTTFVERVSVPGKDSRTFTFSLANSTLSLVGDDIEVNVRGYITQPGKPVSILSTNQVIVNPIKVSDLRFSRVHATLNLTHEFPTIEEELFEDPPEGLENMEFDSLDFTLQFEDFPFNTDVSFLIEGEKTGETLPTASFQISSPANNPNPVVLPSSSLLSIFNRTPERIRLTGNARITGDNVTINRGDQYSVDYNMNLPIMFDITQQTTFTETEEMDLDEDARDAIRDNVLSASLEGTIINSTKLSGTATVRVGETEAEAKNPQTPPLLTIDLPPQGTEGTIDVDLTKVQLDRLASSNFFVAEVSINPATNVEIRTTDCITFENIRATGNFEIDAEDLREDD